MIPAPDFTLVDQYGETHTLSDYAGKTVFLNFWATWCGPCKMLAPVLEHAADQMKYVTFYKVDIDEEQELTNQFKIMSVPTLLFFKDGNLVVQNSGLIRMSELEQLIAKARG